MKYLAERLVDSYSIKMFCVNWRRCCEHLSVHTVTIVTHRPAFQHAGGGFWPFSLASKFECCRFVPVTRFQKPVQMALKANALAPRGTLSTSSPCVILTALTFHLKFQRPVVVSSHLVALTCRKKCQAGHPGGWNVDGKRRRVIQEIFRANGRFRKVPPDSSEGTWDFQQQAKDQAKSIFESGLSLNEKLRLAEEKIQNLEQLLNEEKTYQQLYQDKEERRSI